MAAVAICGSRVPPEAPARLRAIRQRRDADPPRLLRGSLSLAHRRSTGLGQPRVPERPVPRAGERPAPPLHACAVAHRPAPGVAAFAAVRLPELMLVPRLAQSRERR